MPLDMGHAHEKKISGFLDVYRQHPAALMVTMVQRQQLLWCYYGTTATVYCCVLSMDNG
jgi:hypothetical protein